MTIHTTLELFASHPDTAWLLREPELKELSLRNPNTLLSPGEFARLLALCDRVEQAVKEDVKELEGYEKELEEMAKEG